MWNTWLNIFSPKEGREQEDERDTGRLRKTGRNLVALSALVLALIRFVPDAEALYLPPTLYPDFDCELVYIGNDEVGLRIAHQAASGADGVTSYSFQDYQLTILRYIQGQPPESALEVMSYAFPPDAGPREVFFYDQNVTREVTYKYRIKGEFPFTKSSPGAPAESGTFSSTYDSRSIYGQYSATPGHVWGDLPRDTTWEGALNISGWLTIKDGLTLVVPSSAGIGGTGGRSLVVHGKLEIDGATFTSTTPLIPLKIQAKAGSPQISIKNATIQSALEIDASGHDSGLVFEASSGDALCSIKVGAGATNAQVISGNQLPDGRISGYPAGHLTIEDNTLLWITLEGTEETPFEGTISIRGNEILEHIRLKGLTDGTTAGIAENRFGGTRGWIELSDCLPQGTGGLEIRSNQALTYMILDNVNSATVEDNEIGRATSYSFNPYSMDIRKGSDNVIRGNTFTSPPQVGINYSQVGMGLGLAGDEASGNRILDNVFRNYHTGIGLGAANENVIAGNTFESNLISLHLKGSIAGGPASPYGNSIRNNIFRRHPSGEHVRIDVSGDLQNTWSQPKTAGANIVGGPFLGGNYWSDYDGQDADADGIGDSPFTIDAYNTDLLPLIVPVLTLTVSENNPANPEVTVAPEHYKEIDVLGFTLAVSPLAPASVRIDGMLFDFVFDRAEASVVGAVYLVGHQAATYDPDTGAWSPARSDVIAQMPGAARMGFGGSHPLNQVLAPGERRDYTLRYLLEKTDPACTSYGARIAPDQIEATLDGASEPVIPMGETVLGSVFLKGSTLTVSVFPEEAGSVSFSPDTTCYSWNDTVTVTVSPGEGYAFDHFTDAFGLFGDGLTNPAILTMTWGEVTEFFATAFFRDDFPPLSDGKNHGKLKDPVNTATGELYFEIPVFNLGGPFPLACGLYYGSNVSRRNDVRNAFGSVLGPNWLHSYQILRLYKGDQQTDILFYRGKTLRFRQQGTEWAPAVLEDVEYRLKADEESRYYLLDPERELVYVFRPDRLLDRIIDRKGNSHSLFYDSSGNLSRVEDGLGRIISFTYEEFEPQRFRLAGIHDDKGRFYGFSYSDGLLSSIRDPMGNTSRFEYDPDGNGLITSVIYPNGNAPYTQTFEEKGRVDSQTDAFGNVTTLSLPGEGEDKTVITYPGGGAVEHTHEGRQMLTSYKDQTGKVFSMDYDGSRRQRTVTDRLGDTVGMSYHPESGNLSSVTNALGQTAIDTYGPCEQSFDDVGFTFYDVTRITYPDGSVEEFTYDANGNVLARTDRAGKTWTYTYNSRGQVLTATNPAGGIITNTYNPDATLETTEDSDTGTTVYGYDAYKRMNEIVHPDETFIRMACDLNDRVASITDENGNPYTYTYDANGNRTKVTDPKGRETKYAYDPMDRVMQITNRLNNNTSLAYDGLGRIASVTDPNHVAASFGYDPRGWQNRVTLGGQTWQTGYDGEGVVSSKTTPLGNTTTYETNKLGYAASITNPLNQKTTFTRDSMSRITAKTDSLARRTAYIYDNRGLLSGVTTPAIGPVTYTRNDLGLLDTITDLNGNTWTFDYTNMGRPSSTTDPLSNITGYGYDARGRLSHTTFADSSTLDITYDDAGNITQRQYTGGMSLDFTYDELNRLIAADNILLTRDAEGRVTGTGDGDADFTATYDAGGRLETVTYPLTGSGQAFFTVTYLYDGTTGLLSRVTDDLTGTQLGFSYDNGMRLTGLTRVNGVNTTYDYDRAGRITRIRDGSMMDLQYTLDAAGQVTGFDMTAPLDPTVLLSDQTETFGYDNASRVSTPGYFYDVRGRQTRSPGGAFAWDGASRLTGIPDVTLAYNGLGDLVTRTEAGTTTHFYYNKALGMSPIVAEKNDATGQFLRYYVWTPAGRLLYMIDASDSSKVYFYHFDRIGSTLALTDSAGAVTDSYAYTPYGKLLGHNGPSAQPFTFVGEWGVRQDGAGGALYQMGARYYDAQTARFLSKDAVWPNVMAPIQLNPYQYAEANPLSNIDPAGTVPCPDLSLAASALAYSAATLAEDAATLAKGAATLAKGAADFVVRTAKDPIQGPLAAANAASTFLPVALVPKLVIKGALLDAALLTDVARKAVEAGRLEQEAWAANVLADMKIKLNDIGEEQKRALEDIDTMVDKQVAELNKLADKLNEDRQRGYEAERRRLDPLGFDDPDSPFYQAGAGLGFDDPKSLFHQPGFLGQRQAVMKTQEKYPFPPNGYNRW